MTKVKYHQNLEKEKRKKEYWDQLVDKMIEMELNPQEQEVIRQNALHIEASLCREM